jgi:hypothetical protein
MTVPDRFDYDSTGNLDDVVISDVTTFRMEWMDHNRVWIRCYRNGSPDVVFALVSDEKISGTHEYDEQDPE